MRTQTTQRDGSTTRICGLDEIVATLATAYADAVNYDGWMTRKQHRDCVESATVVLNDTKHFNFGSVTGSAFRHLQKEALDA